MPRPPRILSKGRLMFLLDGEPHTFVSNVPIPHIMGGERTYHAWFDAEKSSVVIVCTGTIKTWPGLRSEMRRTIKVGSQRQTLEFTVAMAVICPSGERRPCGESTLLLQEPCILPDALKLFTYG